ncbi:MerR family transcriptional regulator, partial [Vibrio cholerae O1]|nr:MerR family transcriptional regulator [Vibrio cholerae O1]
MRIGEVTRRAGVSVRALRYYEEQDLLRAERSSGGQRRYPDSAVDRVQLIQQLYAAGLPSRSVREVLRSVYAGT